MVNAGGLSEGSESQTNQPTNHAFVAQLTGGRFNDLPDNERAVHSIMVTWFHWGLHGWIAVSAPGPCDSTIDCLPQARVKFIVTARGGTAHQAYTRSVSTPNTRTNPTYLRAHLPTHSRTCPPVHCNVQFTIVGALLAITTYRRGMPMTMRFCFYPLIGDRVSDRARRGSPQWGLVSCATFAPPPLLPPPLINPCVTPSNTPQPQVYGWIGELVDIVSVVVTLLAVGSSLGLGVRQIYKGLVRIDSGTYRGVDTISVADSYLGITTAITQVLV